MSYTQNNTGLNYDEMRRVVPSVFASGKHESRSDRFTYIPTVQVLDGLQEVGFVPTSAAQGRSRIEGKADYTKHLIRLRRVEDLGYTRPDVVEIVLKNAHDGTAAYELMLGIFRLVCTNGLIRGDYSDALKVPHRGNVVQRVVDSTLTLVEDAPRVLDDIQRMKQVELTQPEQLLLAEYGLRARFDLEPDEDPLQKGVIYQPSDFLRARRYADQGSDLYTTFNRVQENAIKGGLRRRDAEGEKHTTRAITGIDQSVKVNRLLWSFAQQLLEIHT